MVKSTLLQILVGAPLQFIYFLASFNFFIHWVFPHSNLIFIYKDNNKHIEKSFHLIFVFVKLIELLHYKNFTGQASQNVTIAYNRTRQQEIEMLAILKKISKTSPIFIVNMTKSYLHLQRCNKYIYINNKFVLNNENTGVRVKFLIKRPT